VVDALVYRIDVAAQRLRIEIHALGTNAVER